MNDLKHYPGKIVEKPAAKGWRYWFKHHMISVGFIVLVLIVCVSFLWGKSSLILVDTNGPKEFKAGARKLSHQEFPSTYRYKEAMILEVFCIDGVRMVVFDEGLSSQVIGSCE